MKRCTACDTEKPSEEFYKNAASEDGLTYRCRSCLSDYQKTRRERLNASKPDEWKKKTLDMSAYMKAWRQENREKCREYEKKRVYNPEKEREKYVRRMMRLHGEGWVPGQSTRPADPLAEVKRKARGVYKTALRRGKLIKTPCHVCGEEKVEGHHPDYSRPLDVVWLCRQHHLEIHS